MVIIDRENKKKTLYRTALRIHSCNKKKQFRLLFFYQYEGGKEFNGNVFTLDIY